MRDSQTIDSVQPYDVVQIPDWDRFLRAAFETCSGAEKNIPPTPPADFRKVLPKKTRKVRNGASYARTLRGNLLSAIVNQRLCARLKLTITDRFTPGHSRVVAYPRYNRIKTDAEAWASLEFSILVLEEDTSEGPMGDVPDFEILHAIGQMERQHRTFTFTIVVQKEMFYVLRWDHSEIMKSAQIDYVSDPSLLADFLWKYNTLAKIPEARGFDSSLTLATYSESLLYTKAIRDYLGHVKTGRLPLIPNAPASLDRSYPVYKVHLDKDQEVIIRRPFFANRGIFDGAVTGYLAYHTTECHLVFLKDNWALHHHSSDWPEPEIYKFLSGYSLPNLPVILYAGEVTFQGRPQISVDHRQGGTLDQRVHERIVQELLYPLESLTNSKQFVQVMRDAIHAADDAFTRASILHRDISHRNIMATPDGRGVLNDWGLAIFGGDRAGVRGGTDAFMSCSILLDHCMTHQQDHGDDIESSFWVLLFNTLRYFVPLQPDWSYYVRLFEYAAQMTASEGPGLDEIFMSVLSDATGVETNEHLGDDIKEETSSGLEDPNEEQTNGEDQDANKEMATEHLNGTTKTETGGKLSDTNEEKTGYGKFDDATEEEVNGLEETDGLEVRDGTKPATIEEPQGWNEEEANSEDFNVTNTVQPSGGQLRRDYLGNFADPDYVRQLPIPCAPLKDLLCQFCELLGKYYAASDRLSGESFTEGYGPDDEREDLKRKEAMEDAKAVLKLFDDALARDDWLENDSLPLQIAGWGSDSDGEGFPLLTRSLGFPDGVDEHTLMELIPANYDPPPRKAEDTAKVTPETDSETVESKVNQKARILDNHPSPVSPVQKEPDTLRAGPDTGKRKRDEEAEDDEDETILGGVIASFKRPRYTLKN